MNTRLRLPVFCLCVTLCAATACKKGGSGSDSANPMAPSSTGLSGVWVGTLSRTDGQPPIAVRFEATHSSTRIAGPVELTVRNITLRGSIEDSISGEGSSASFGFPINIRDNPALPNCAVRAGGNGPVPRFQNFNNSSRSMTSTPFAMDYFSCQGFVEPTPPAMSRTESGVTITLTKQ